MKTDRGYMVKVCRNYWGDWERKQWPRKNKRIVSSDLSHVRLFVTPWTEAWQASWSITNPQSLLKLMSIEVMIPFIQPSHPLSSHSPPAFNLSQHQGLFKWLSSSHQVDKVLEFLLQHQSFQCTPRTDFFTMDWLDTLLSKGLSRVFSNTTVQKHQFFCAQLSSQSNPHIHTWLLEKP